MPAANAAAEAVKAAPAADIGRRCFRLSPSSFSEGLLEKDPPKRSAPGPHPKTRRRRAATIEGLTKLDSKFQEKILQGI